MDSYGLVAPPRVAPGSCGTRRSGTVPVRCTRLVQVSALAISNARALVEVTQALASSQDHRDILLTVVRRVAEILRVPRVSIVVTPRATARSPSSVGNTEFGYVVVASDNEELSNLRIDLAKYPEIQEVMRTRESLTIEDTKRHPLFESVILGPDVSVFGAVTLVPLVRNDEALGVLFLRAPHSRGTLSDEELWLCQTIANTTAIAMYNAQTIARLRERSAEAASAHYAAERRLETLTKYADLFDAAADGLAAISMDGVLLFGNPSAFELIGYKESELLGRDIRSVLDPTEKDTSELLFTGFRRGLFPKRVDVRVRHSNGSQRVFCISSAAFGEDDDAVLLSIRDVTDERNTAAELAHTKQFLESLIDASPDAIIAADLNGNILLFNGGAERISGHRATDVIGQLNVRSLYPDDGAREVMKRLRHAQEARNARVENLRMELVNTSGERIPISLSAGFITEHGRPIATVGIFIDLRERLRVEASLEHAQAQLAMTEKQSLLAELAGTAAHELNQPLTSVMVYGELLKRKIPVSSAEHQYAQSILRESERMADIVRKIGKITKYETKSYVGTQRILDLDRASEEPAPRFTPAPSRPKEEVDPESGPIPIAVQSAAGSGDGERSQ